MPGFRFHLHPRIAAALGCTLLANLLMLLPWAASHAVEGASSSDGDVPVVCGDQVVESLGPDGHRYIGTWVPPGGRLSMFNEGVLNPDPYVFGTYVVQYYLDANLSVDGAFVQNLAGIASMGAQPTGAAYPFTGNSQSWVNDTGAWKLAAIDISTRLALNSGGVSYTTTPRVNGQPTTICSPPFDGSEMFGLNPAMGQQCPPCSGSTSNSVDTRSGNEHFELPGVSVASRGPGLDLSFSHNSNDVAFDGPLGPGWRFSYGMVSKVLGNQRIVIQENGSTVTFTAGTGGAWTAPPRFDAQLTVDADGRSTFTRNRSERFRFDETGRLIWVEDRNGYRTTLTYDGDELRTVEDDAGRSLTFSWTPRGRISGVTAPAADNGARSLGMTYSEGRLATFEDIGGGTWTLGHDDDGRLTSVRTPRFVDDPDKAWTFHYDETGRTDWESDPLGRVTEIHYDDPAPGATRVVEPDGDARVDWYDSLGRRTKITHAYGTSLQSATEMTFDASTWMLKKVVDGRGKEWQSQYTDTANPLRVTKTIDPLGRERSMGYNAQGDLTSLTDGEGVQSTWTYDAAGNPETHTQAVGTPDEAFTDLVYGDAGHAGDVTKVIDPRGKEWAYGYNGQTGARVWAEDPLGHRTTWSHNPSSWVTASVPPRGNVAGADPADFRTSISYDDYGSTTSVVDAEGDETSLTYDPDGNLKRVTSPASGTVENTWTAAGQLASTTSGVGTPAAQTTLYSYWADGRQKSWSTRADSVWKTDWDPAGRLKSQEDPLGNVTGYAWDPAGNLISVTRPGGDCGSPRTNCITYTRDAAGQVTEIDYSDPDTPDVTQTFDDNGLRLTQTVAGQGTATWTWTKRMQLATDIDSAGLETRYAWDKTGNLKTLTYPGQSVPVTYGYDDAGRMTSTEDWRGNRTNFTYDENSNLVTTAFPGDTGLIDRRSYDPLDQLEEVTWDRTGQSALGSLELGRTADGQVSTATSAGVPASASSFDYDSRNQLKVASGGTSPGVGAYEYDERGYLTRSPAGFTQSDKAGQLTSSTSQISAVGNAVAYGSPVAGTMTVNLPSGIMADDQILLFVTMPTSGNLGAPPAGYSLVTTHEQSGGVRLAVFRKTASGGETSATVSAGYGVNRSVMAVVYRGVDSADPIVATSGAGSTTGTDVTVPELTAPLVGTQLVIGTGGINSALSSSVTFPAGMDQQVSIDNRIQVAGGVGDQTLTSTGATGPRTVTYSTAMTKAAVMLALRPRATSFDYDTAGNRTGREAPSGDTAYTYDLEDRLTSAGSLDGYAYDGDGLRAEAPIGGTDTHFSWARGFGLPMMLTETPRGTDGAVDLDRASSYVYGPGGQILTRLDPEQPVTLVGSGAVTNSASFVTKLNVPIDPDVEYGDQILVAVTHHNGTTPTVPAGYTEIGTRTNGSTVLRLWRHTATASEPTTLEVTFTNAASAPKSAVSLAYRGVDPTNPVVDIDSAIPAGNGTGTSVTIPSLDPAKAGDQVVTLLGSTGGLAGGTDTWTPPADQTLRESTRATGGLSGIALAAADKTTTSADPTGDMPFGYTESSKLAGFGVVLRKAPPAERWYHTDHLGSARILSDGSGRTVATASYTPYGETVNPTGEAMRMGFTGEYTDVDTGLIYLRARYYDPATGQFITRDPLLGISHDPYAYAANDPVNLTDPTGEMVPLVPILIGAAIGGGLDLGLQAAGNLANGCSAFHDISWGRVAFSSFLGGLGGGFWATRGVGLSGKYGQSAVGDARSYVNLTQGNSIRNIGTNTTRTEFSETLIRGGWSSRPSKNGAVEIFQKDGAKYVLRKKNSSGYPGWTADFTPAGSRGHILEIRLGYTQ